MSTAKKYKRRQSPRLKLDEASPVVVRFRSSRHRFIQTSRVVDISETGLALLSSKRLAPGIGDVIKMELAPFSSFQMACLGRVVRIEEPGTGTNWATFPNTVKVGIQFHELPLGYRKALARSLKEAFKQNKQAYKDKPIDVTPHVSYDFSNLWPERMWTYIAGAALVVAFGFLFYWIVNTVQSNPRAAAPDAPWASGFFDKVINKSDQ